LKCLKEIANPDKTEWHNAINDGLVIRISKARF
jgi:hypothetical protein